MPLLTELGIVLVGGVLQRGRSYGAKETRTSDCIGAGVL